MSTSWSAVEVFLLLAFPPLTFPPLTLENHCLPLAALYSVNVLTDLVDLIELASCALEVVLGPGLSIQFKGLKTSWKKNKTPYSLQSRTSSNKTFTFSRQSALLFRETRFIETYWLCNVVSNLKMGITPFGTFLCHHC